jgi:hypothetical protein
MIGLLLKLVNVYVLYVLILGMMAYFLGILLARTPPFVLTQMLLTIYSTKRVIPTHYSAHNCIPHSSTWHDWYDNQFLYLYNIAMSNGLIRTSDSFGT